MVRPLKTDRESIALTHVRISPKTKALLDRLKAEGGYKTHDEALLSLILSPGQPSKALTITNLLNRPDVNKLISDTAREVYHNHVKPGSSRPRPDNKKGRPAKARARSRSSFKSNYKF